MLPDDLRWRSMCSMRGIMRSAYWVQGVGGYKSMDRRQAEGTESYHRRCTRCLLPETFPDITFDEDGVCNYCVEYLEKGKKTPRWQTLREKRVERLIEKSRNKGDYDCLVSYSGGKDSTYLLYVLKEKYGLNVLAYTCNTGF